MELKDLAKNIQNIHISSPKTQDGKTETHKQLKKRVKGGAAAGAVAASVLLSSLFGSPAELVNPNEEHLGQRPAVVQMMDMDVPEEEEDNDNDDSDKARVKKGLSQRLKERILRMPVAVRALVGVPLWAIGWALTSLLGLAWDAAGGVVLPIILKFVILLAVIFLIVFLTVKALHPDMPAKKILKKMLRKKNILYFVIGAAVLTAADTVLLLVLEDYAIWRRLIIFVIGLILLFLILRPFIAKAVRKRKNRLSKFVEEA